MNFSLNFAMIDLLSLPLQVFRSEAKLRVQFYKN
jgi:hypothetical protein